MLRTYSGADGRYPLFPDKCLNAHWPLPQGGSLDKIAHC
ncbi:Uncharacterized protein ChrSV_0896 [Chromobacterium vaccinii]|nr:Uncharacterized protein ChrSW_0896 [Chromobacterium vaccinii]QND88355.1 Uncharacterized protein ChrSV_0896 [Chromobacterium vaccinii]